MNYQELHDALIQRARSRVLPSETYSERHHIQMIAIRPDLRRDPTNIVTLTGREHFLIHNLLRRIYPDEPKYLYAFIRMSHVNQYTADGRSEIIVKYARAFEQARKEKAERFRARKVAFWSDPANKALQRTKMMGNDYGSQRTEEGRKRTGASTQTPEYRQRVSERMRRRWENTELRQAASLRMMGNQFAKGNVPTPEQIEKHRLSRAGYTHSNDTKQKIAGSIAQQWVVTSPDGVAQTITNLNQFCRDNHLDQGNMVKVSKGILRATKGWTCQKVAS